MLWHIIGEIALNLSSLIYFIWFIPQLMLTFKQRRTSALSLWMHSLLVLGYVADLVYGYGQYLPFQYKAVTWSGLLMLAIEHYQFWSYSQWQRKEKIIFQALTLGLVLLFLSGVYQITLTTRDAQFYNAVGVFSWVCWLSFMWPQVVKNFSNRSAAGVSMQTVLLSLLSSVGDIISAFALAWAWPSKWGALLGVVPKLLLLMQCYYYRSNLARVRTYALAS